MDERQREGVKSLARYRVTCGISAVNGITRQRHSDAAQVNANLVRASCMECAMEKGA